MEISLQCFANLVEEGVCDHRGLDLLNATQSGNTTGLISSNPSRPLWRSFPACLRAETPPEVADPGRGKLNFCAPYPLPFN